MFWMLLTAVFAGFAGAGIGMLLRHLSGKRLPKGIIPVLVGFSMIAATIGMEYGWYPATLETLPPDSIVITEREQQAWYQPWTFVRPWVRGFLSYAPSETTETAAGSGILVIQTTLQERWNPGIVKPILVDCAGSRRAEILEDTTFDENGHSTNAPWRNVTASDPILSAVCDGEAVRS